MVSKQTLFPPTKGCKCQAQSFPLLQLVGMPAPVKNTNTHMLKKNHYSASNLAEHSH